MFPIGLAMLHASAFGMPSLRRTAPPNVLCQEAPRGAGLAAVARRRRGKMQSLQDRMQIQDLSNLYAYYIDELKIEEKKSRRAKGDRQG